MKRLAAVAIALILAACGEPPPPEPSAASPASTPTAAASASVTPSSVPSPAATPRPFASGTVVQVLVPSLNLRSGPGQDARALGVVHTGQRMVITAGPEDDGRYRWYEVSRGRAVDGWLAGGTADESYLAAVTTGGLAFRYVDGGRVGIGLMGGDVSEPTILEGAPTRLAWSPDGSLLAFVWRRSPGAQPEIFVMRADGSDRQRIAAGNQFAWSPDSTRIAVPERDHIIYHSASDGQDVGRLPLGRLRHVRDLAWSPDSRRRDRDIWALAADTGTPQRITRHGRHDTPVWAPAANRLVFNSPSGVQISDPFGDEVHQVAQGRVSQGGWSPDGLFLLLQRFGGIDTLDLCLLVSGTIASDDRSTTVSGGSWSPDGMRILFYRSARQGGVVEAWTANADGGDASRAPNATAPASWQPLLERAS